VVAVVEHAEIMITYKCEYIRIQSVGVRSGGKLIQVSVTSVIDHQRISVHVLVRALIGVAFLPIPTLPYWRFHITHIYSTAYTHE